MRDNSQSLVKSLEQASDHKERDLEKQRQLSLRRLALRLEKRKREKGPMSSSCDTSTYNSLLCELSGISFRALMRGCCHSALLHSAAAHGIVNDIYILHKLGADVNACDNGGCSPVWAAAWKGHATAIKALHDCGANINKPDNDGWTPLYVASSSGQSEAIQVLLKLGAMLDVPEADQRTPLYIAALMGHISIVRALCDGGADIDSPDHHGWSPLWIAAKFGHLDVTRLLLACGADVFYIYKNANSLGNGQDIIAPLTGAINEAKRLMPRQHGSASDVFDCGDTERDLCAAYSLCQMMSCYISPHSVVERGLNQGDAAGALLGPLLGIHSTTQLRIVQHFDDFNYAYRRRIVRFACSVHEWLLRQHTQCYTHTPDKSRHYFCELVGQLADVHMLTDLYNSRLISKSCHEERRFPVVMKSGRKCYTFLEANIMESWIALEVSRFLPTKILGAALCAIHKCDVL